MPNEQKKDSIDLWDRNWLRNSNARWKGLFFSQGMLIAGLLLISVSAIEIVLRDQNLTSAFVSLVFGIGCLVAGIATHNGMSAHLIASGTILLAIPFLSYRILTLSGLISPASTLFIFMPICASIFVSRKFTILTIVLGLVAMACISYIELNQVFVFASPYSPYAYYVEALHVFTLFASFSALALYYESNSKESEYLKTRELEKMIQATKLNSLGQLAGGLAHEVNNPASIIFGYAEQIEICLDEEPIDKEAIKTMAAKTVRATKRILGIVRSLQDFSAEGESLDPKPTTVVDVLDIAIRDVQDRLDENKIKLIRPDNIWSYIVKCDSKKLSHALINLLNNAVDFVKEIPDPEIKIDVLAGRKHMRIFVSNNGPLIDKKLSENIMQPFFTTKQIGEGMGLGLSTAKGIIEKHDGRLYLDTDQKLTTFVIELPLIQEMNLRVS